MYTGPMLLFAALSIMALMLFRYRRRKNARNGDFEIAYRDQRTNKFFREKG